MYYPGDYYMYCDVCGGKSLASEMTQAVDLSQRGLWVHRGCLDSRNPQDTIKTVKDTVNAPVVRNRVDNDVGYGDIQESDL